VRVQNQSFNKRDMNNHGQTDGYSEQPLPLMLPQDVNELSYDKQLISCRARKTEPIKILARKIFYYEEEVSRSRANMPPPLLPIGDALKIDSLIVAVRAVEAKVVVSDGQQMRADSRCATSKRTGNQRANASGKSLIRIDDPYDEEHA
jgi:type IV secretion system protein VirD4